MHRLNISGRRGGINDLSVGELGVVKFQSPFMEHKSVRSKNK